MHKIALRAAQARKITHPALPDIDIHFFLVRAGDVPPNLTKDANARDFEGRDLNKRVYRDVTSTLLGNMGIPGTFDLLNKGITVIAKSVRRLKQEDEFAIEVDKGQGIVDGGHTYDIITRATSDPDIEVPDDQFVWMRVLTGIPDGWISEISMGLNTGIAVKEHSLSFLDGKFVWLEDEMKRHGHRDLVAWRESDEANYDVRDLICVLEALNVFDYPNGTGDHPVTAYEKWSVPARKFAKDFDSSRDAGDFSRSVYHRLRPLLPGGLVLMDRIRGEFRTVWNSEFDKGRAAGLSIIEHARGKRMFQFPFAGLPSSKYRLTKGAAYPIFASFRNAVAVNPQTGSAEWVGSLESVLALWDDMKPHIARSLQQAIKDYGHKPDMLGKHRGFWDQMHQRVENHILRKRYHDAAA